MVHDSWFNFNHTSRLKWLRMDCLSKWTVPRRKLTVRKITGLGESGRSFLIWTGHFYSWPPTLTVSVWICWTGWTRCFTEIVRLSKHAPWLIGSTLTAIIFLYYRVATKMAREILGFTMCRVRLWWLVSLLDWRWWSYFSGKSTIRVLLMAHESWPSQINTMWFNGYYGSPRDDLLSLPDQISHISCDYDRSNKWKDVLRLFYFVKIV